MGELRMLGESFPWLLPLCRVQLRMLIFSQAMLTTALSLMPLILQGHLVGIFWLVRNVVGMFFFFGGMFYRYAKVNSDHLF